MDGHPRPAELAGGRRVVAVPKQRFSTAMQFYLVSYWVSEHY